jgi:hypothetical protein
LRACREAEREVVQVEFAAIVPWLLAIDEPA